MDSQTPHDYKEYFLNKFINLFQTFVNDCLNKVQNDEIKNDLDKIKKLFSKLNYIKIIEKICSNTKLQEGITFILKNDFNDDIMQKVFSSTDANTWTLMPHLHLNKIFNQVTPENRKILYDQFHALHVCSFTYTKVLESMNSTTNTNGDFNPFDSVGKVAENMDINTMFDGVETKTMSAYEMLMEQVLNQEMEGKMSNYIKNIEEDDVNQAADKLIDVLKSDNFEKNKQSTQILSNMLSKIKDEVINLKNEPIEKVKGKKGFEQLVVIAQKIANGMMTNIKDNNVNVLDLWDATSNLAKSATNSEALNIVDKLIRTNIENTLNQVQTVNQQNTESVESSDVSTDNKKSRKHKKR
jgi:flagellar biosynthesis regulator FlbT